MTQPSSPKMTISVKHGVKAPRAPLKSSLTNLQEHADQLILEYIISRGSDGTQLTHGRISGSRCRLRTNSLFKTKAKLDVGHLLWIAEGVYELLRQFSEK
jgi:hypothetical protein